MAKRKPDEPKKGAPEWQCTFSDLMNLLLCFFVLLFSMSSIEEDKWEEVVASMTSAFSIFSDGSTSIGEGSLVGIGTSQLSNLDEYYSSMGQTAEDENADDIRKSSEGTADEGESGKGSSTEGTTTEDIDVENDSYFTGGIPDTQFREMIAAAGKAETEEMLDFVSEAAERYNISDMIDVGADEEGKYVEIVISGSVLFDSGSAELKKECLPLLSKVGDILKIYQNHYVDVIGHTDNVPMNSVRFPDNDSLSSARAISAAQYLVKEKGLSVTNISWTGRGEYDPIASNSTSEGRARNRRVEIRIYNSYSSK